MTTTVSACKGFNCPEDCPCHCHKEKWNENVETCSGCHIQWKKIGHSCPVCFSPAEKHPTNPPTETTVEKWEDELHNSEYWHNIYLMVSGCEIIDPDGWDRKNYEVSWYQEEITWAEFQKRAMTSTQWTLPLDKRYEKIFSFLSHSVQEAKAERDNWWVDRIQERKNRFNNSGQWEVLDDLLASLKQEEET